MGAFLMTLMMGKNVAEELALLDVAIAERVVGVTIGVFLMFMGNSIPKVLTPISKMRCDPARAQAVQRYAGLVFMLAGFAITVAWIATPIDVAPIVMLAAAGLSLILVIPRKIQMYSRVTRCAPREMRAKTPRQPRLPPPPSRRRSNPFAERPQRLVARAPSPEVLLRPLSFPRESPRHVEAKELPA